MAVETERKFLVGPGWREHSVQCVEVRQGYLCADPARVVRIRVADGRAATLTVKGPRVGARRAEFEYPIPVQDARELLDGLCLRPLVEKRRHTLFSPGGPWVVDEFFGVNAGLVLAELEAPDAEQVTGLPAWVREEVTTDPRFDNAYLQQHPYPLWAPAPERERGAVRSTSDADLVIFDNDGVLVDSEVIANEELASLLTELGVVTSFEDSVRRYLGGSLDRVRELVRADSGIDLPEDLGEIYHRRLFAALRGRLRPVPGIRELLVRLAEQGVPFCVASSSSRERLALTLELTGLAEFFEDRVYSAQDVARGKPAPDLFHHAAARMGVDPERAVVVEDSGPGVAAARAAGMACVGFAALTSAQVLADADQVVRSSAELGRLLPGHASTPG